ncbi:hypothetical protein SAMN05444007_103401 [Cribrihabitans marinus]|uniref:Uncharacterized protein n=1 Tax=Cribrihabitans marinus TaxID=1227549 RepID=A0A1H6WHN9_9RHOB|nr:hypothetical protein [Cribrihabitans marinus]GGH24394.1 hypothetical protein GCM10010973_10890 [Cribrihabitans marinus]SEJ13617.1 hypothetical protein SAMN05444007_103401 [Cribrihabitans marinus]
MSFIFPLQFREFAAGLRVNSQEFDLSESLRVTEDGGGRMLVSESGPRLWQGSLTITTDTHVAQDQAQALAQVMRSAGASFLIGNLKRKFPKADPMGSILGAASVTLSAPITGSNTISLSGLPSGYVLTAGDYLSFAYGDEDEKVALHQVTVGGVAETDGTLTVGVVSRVRPGAFDGAAVTLIGAACKAIIVPGSFKAGRIGLASTSGFSFSFKQTLR